MAGQMRLVSPFFDSSLLLFSSNELSSYYLLRFVCLFYLPVEEDAFPLSNTSLVKLFDNAFGERKCIKETSSSLEID